MCRPDVLRELLTTVPSVSMVCETVLFRDGMRFFYWQPNSQEWKCGILKQTTNQEARKYRLRVGLGSARP
jgi:hypothetical protein